MISYVALQLQVHTNVRASRVTPHTAPRRAAPRPLARQDDDDSDDDGVRLLEARALGAPPPRRRPSRRRRVLRAERARLPLLRPSVSRAKKARRRRRDDDDDDRGDDATGAARAHDAARRRIRRKRRRRRRARGRRAPPRSPPRAVHGRRERPRHRLRRVPERALSRLEPVADVPDELLHDRSYEPAVPRAVLRVHDELLAVAVRVIVLYSFATTTTQPFREIVNVRSSTSSRHGGGAAKSLSSHRNDAACNATGQSGTTPFSNSSLACVSLASTSTKSPSPSPSSWRYPAMGAYRVSPSIGNPSAASCART
eukprot:21079-Pelagococcus_subviridis.AAC.2